MTNPKIGRSTQARNTLSHRGVARSGDGPQHMNQEHLTIVSVPINHPTVAERHFTEFPQTIDKILQQLVGLSLLEV